MGIKWMMSRMTRRDFKKREKRENDATKNEHL